MRSLRLALRTLRRTAQHELPGDRPPATDPSYRSGIHWSRLPGELAASVHALARAADATAFMALLAAWELQLGRYTGREDFVIGSRVEGRPD